MSTQKQQLFILVIFLITVLLVVADVSAIEGPRAQAFVGQDLNLVAKHVISYQISTGEHVLVFQNGVSMTIGANQFSADKAVVWLESEIVEFRGRTRVDYNAKVYLEGNARIKMAGTAKTTDIRQAVGEEGGTMTIEFGVSGEVYVTADKREVTDPRELDIYKKAEKVFTPVKEYYVEADAIVPQLQPEEATAEKAGEKQQVVKPAKKAAKSEKVKVAKKGLVEPKQKTVKPGKPAEVQAVGEQAEEKELKFSYPVNISPAGDAKLKIESAKAEEGIDIATITQRFYVWQQQDEAGNLLELQADSAVVFYSGQGTEDVNKNDSDSVLAKGAVRAIYMSGDVVMTEGSRTIRADEMYYDFQQKKGLAVNVVMRSYDSNREIPIYVRAAKMRQLARNKFSAENIVLTTSEFYLPQISTSASSIIVTDTTAVDEQMEKLSNSSYDAQMRDVRMKVGGATVFYWPFLRSNLEIPDIPLKSVHMSYDNDFGASLETRWYLSRLLGLKEPVGVNSTLAVDYFGKRGVGVGVEIEYNREKYFGRILSYIIKDHGKDTLGRHTTREDVEPPDDLRGRFSWLHRQFLPHKWELTAGVDYTSDEYFMEGFYRNEYNVGQRETYVHLKRIEDNQGISILGKGRINNFADELEELPTVEYHRTGQSLFNERFTLYSDTQVSRLRQTIGQNHSLNVPDERFTFASHRTELDMPLRSGSFKLVPYAAGTFGYDDRSGFTRTLVDGSDTGKFGESSIGIAEAGVRVSHQPLWKVYPNVKSRLWDLNQLRHVISPSLTAAVYEESDSVVEQRDMLNLAATQRLQTKRGPEGKLRTVDWMRLDTEITWVRDSESASDSGPGPDRFIWAKPLVPLRVLSSPGIFNSGLISDFHRFELFGPRRNYFGADYLWRVSDSSAILSDMNFDIQSGAVQQFDIGYSRMVWPNLSYYIGSRYLRRVEILDEKGTNAVTFAATYKLDPRYTFVFSQQYDFDYGTVSRNNITLIRTYHRMAMSFTYSVDHSVRRQAIIFSLWPQGMPEMALGSRRCVEMGGSPGY